MKLSALAVIMTFVFGATVVMADDPKGPPQGGATTGTPDKDKQLRMMQEHMLKMHEMMHKIMDAKSPQEKERLMKEQRDMMAQHMDMMRGMMGGMGPGMGPGMMHGKRGPGGQGPAGDNPPDAGAHQH